MERLTPRQQEIYDYLCSHLDDHGYPPTLREICAEFNMRSTRAASDHLQALERKGFIVRHRDRSRGIELYVDRPGRVPVIAVIGRHHAACAGMRAGKPECEFVGL